MKKTIGIMGVIALSMISISVKAQETPAPAPAPVQSWEAKNNPTVDSIKAKYKDKLVAAPTAPGLEKIFPVIGKYESAMNPEVSALTISLDAQNKGLIWVEGLPQGKVKGLLARSPSTYKIPAQKTEDGKEVAEGTLIYDKELNTLSICIGKPYNAENPAAVFAEPVAVETTTTTVKTTKSKKPASPKAWVYTGTKVDQATAGN